MHRKPFKMLAILLCLSLIFQQTGFAQMAGVLDISGYFSGLHSTLVQEKFRPVHLRYLEYDTDNNNFRLLLDKGNTENPKDDLIKDQASTLFNYFLIGLALPNSTFWVNLRPDSAGDIIDPFLAQTDLGKVLLEADLELKKDTANYTSPQTPIGKEYWKKLYAKAQELYGDQNVTIPTLTRPWIVPGEIIIKESSADAYIYKATLKVMLEEDRLAEKTNLTSATDYSFTDVRQKALNKYASQLIRELIIPKLTQEVNSSKKYSNLKQAYYSLILAQWFKSRFKASPREGLTFDAYNLTGLTSKVEWSKDTYFKQYQKSFKDGEYNVKETVQTPLGGVIRSYVSGGMDLGLNQIPASEENRMVTQKSNNGNTIFKIIRDGGKGLFFGALFSLLVSVSVFGQDKTIVVNKDNNAIGTTQVVGQAKQQSWVGLREKISAALKNVQGNYIKDFLNEIDGFSFSKPDQLYSFKIPIKDGGITTGYLKLDVANNIKVMTGGGYPFIVGRDDIYYSFRIVKFDNKGSEYYMGASAKFYPFTVLRSYGANLNEFARLISSAEFQNSLTPLVSNGAASIPGLIISNLRQNGVVRGSGQSAGYSIHYNDTTLKINSLASANTAQIVREPYVDTTNASLNVSVRLIADKSGSTEYTLDAQKNDTRSFIDEGIVIEWVTSVTSENPQLQKYNQNALDEYFNKAAGKTLITPAVNQSLRAKGVGKKIIVLNTDYAEQDTAEKGWAPVDVEVLRPSFDEMVGNLEKNDGYLIISVQDYFGHAGNKANLLQLIDGYLENLPAGAVQRIYYQKSAPNNVAKTVAGIIRSIGALTPKLIVPGEIAKDQVEVGIRDGNGNIVYTENIAGVRLPNQTTVKEFIGYTPNARVLQFDNNNGIIGLPGLAFGETAKRTVVFENQEIVMQSGASDNFYVLEDLSGTRTPDLDKQKAALERLMSLPGFSGVGLFGSGYQYLNKGDVLDMSIIYKKAGGGGGTAALPVKTMLETVLQKGAPATVYIIGDLLFNMYATSISPEFVEQLVAAKIKVVLLLPSGTYDYAKNMVNSPDVNSEMINAFNYGFLANNYYSKYLLSLSAATNPDFFYKMTDSFSVAEVIQRLSGEGEIKKFVPKEVYLDIYDKAGNILRKESYKVAPVGKSSGNQKFVIEKDKISASSPIQMGLNLLDVDFNEIQQKISSINEISPEIKAKLLDTIEYMRANGLIEIGLSENQDSLSITDGKDNEITRMLSSEGYYNKFFISSIFLLLGFKRNNPGRLSGLVAQGNAEAVSEIIQLARIGDESAIEEIKNLPVKSYVDLVAQGEIEALWSLIDFAKFGNQAARDFLRNDFNPDVFGQRAMRGDKDALQVLRVVAKLAENVSVAKLLNEIDKPMAIEEAPEIARPDADALAPGGIDFRMLPIVTQPAMNIIRSIGVVSFEKFDGINLGQEINNLQGMANAGMVPSTERIKDYIQAAYLRGEPDRDMEKVVLCIAEILKLDEINNVKTDPALEDILAAIDSQTTPGELKYTFLGINPPV